MDTNDTPHGRLVSAVSFTFECSRFIEGAVIGRLHAMAIMRNVVINLDKVHNGWLQRVYVCRVTSDDTDLKTADANLRLFNASYENLLS